MRRPVGRALCAGWLIAASAVGAGAQAPVDEDRTGREHRLQVEVKRNGLTVRVDANGNMVSTSAGRVVVSPVNPAAPAPRAGQTPQVSPSAVVAREPFKVADVLRPELVRPFIDGLQKRLPPSGAFQTVVDRAKAGIFPAGEVEAQGQSAAMATFIGGLAALNAGRIPQATALFQQTLKAAPTFVGVAFYLGACHAANGQDREAIGAWQMSLLSEGAAGVYPVLVDALLRVGETKKALELIEESGANQDLLFLGLQLLYRENLTQGLSDADRLRFRTWARQYEDANGPELELVRRWLASIEP